MKFERLGDQLNSWGEPVREVTKRKVSQTESFDDRVRKKYLIEETEKESLAESKLNAIQFRLNKIQHKLLNGRVSVNLIEASQPEEARFQVKVFGSGHFDFPALTESLQRHGYLATMTKPKNKEFEIKVNYDSEMDQALIERLISSCFN